MQAHIATKKRKKAVLINAAPRNPRFVNSALCALYKVDCVMSIWYALVPSIELQNRGTKLGELMRVFRT